MDVTVSNAWIIFITILVIWDIAWKALAMWRASHNNQSGWFVALLVLNTAGILPIIYLLTHGGIHVTQNKDKWQKKPVPIV